MRTFNRICIEDYELTAKNGDCMKLTWGRKYLTSAVRDDGTVIVLTNYWEPAPVAIFAGEWEFTKA